MIKLFVVLLVTFTHLAASAAWDLDQDALKIPAPPKKGSAAERKDFEVLLGYQNGGRTKAECKAAGLQWIPTLASLFGPRTGLLSGDEVKELKEFGSEIIETVSKACEPFKEHWQRQRPYDVDVAVEPCIRKPGGRTSYPSSHAAMGIVLGDVLAEIYPEKKAALQKQGLRIGEFRVLGGIHHPSDIEAGRKIGHQVRDQLMENSEFLKELKKIQ